MAIAAIGQICSTSSMNHNLSQCLTLVHKAVAAKAKALFLPEASDYIAPSPAETISLARPVTTSPFVLGLQAAAKQHALSINVGIHEPTSTGKKVKNTLIWIDEHGAITQRYQKLHLFDVDIPGGPVLKESDSVEPGQDILPPFETPVGILGAMICFDLRFPTLSTRLRERGAQVLVYPSAFTVPTGRAGHWEGLIKARAIENQAYVFAAAQVGRHGGPGGKRISWGHSLAVDPWGKVLHEGGGVEEWDANEGAAELLVVDVNLQALEKVRQEMPLAPRRDIVDIVER